eukprot:TRINITY_DN81488_c0_g1_i1.p1 TRINITY_DN81488_c0_g1~~TRINITY_DN81488_c0_g1_i1.p1  ORF type:complete len:600 (+),score=160.34 TRINITY_DN81488_c0_g1_i1:146-1945(+)
MAVYCSSGDGDESPGWRREATPDMEDPGDIASFITDQMRTFLQPILERFQDMEIRTERLGEQVVKLQTDSSAWQTKQAEFGTTMMDFRCNIKKFHAEIGLCNKLIEEMRGVNSRMEQRVLGNTGFVEALQEQIRSIERFTPELRRLVGQAETETQVVADRLQRLAEVVNVEIRRNLDLHFHSIQKVSKENGETAHDMVQLKATIVQVEQRAHENATRVTKSMNEAQGYRQTLDDLRDKQAMLASKVEAYRADVSRIPPRLEALQKETAMEKQRGEGQDIAVKEVLEKHGHLMHDLEQVRKANLYLSSSFDDLRNNLRDVRGAQTETQEAATKAFDMLGGFDKRIRELDLGLQKAHLKAAGIDNKYKSVFDDFDTVKSSINDVARDQQTSAGMLTASRTEMDRLQRAVAGLQGMIEVVTNDISKLRRTQAEARESMQQAAKGVERNRKSFLGIQKGFAETGHLLDGTPPGPGGRRHSSSFGNQNSFNAGLPRLNSSRAGSTMGDDDDHTTIPDSITPTPMRNRSPSDYNDLPPGRERSHTPSDFGDTAMPSNFRPTSAPAAAPSRAKHPKFGESRIDENGPGSPASPLSSLVSPPPLASD